jgi:hypothetical protein
MEKANQPEINHDNEEQTPHLAFQLAHQLAKDLLDEKNRVNQTNHQEAQSEYEKIIEKVQIIKSAYENLQSLVYASDDNLYTKINDIMQEGVESSFDIPEEIQDAMRKLQEEYETITQAIQHVKESGIEQDKFQKFEKDLLENTDIQNKIEALYNILKDLLLDYLKNLHEEIDEEKNQKIKDLEAYAVLSDIEEPNFPPENPDMSIQQEVYRLKKIKSIDFKRKENKRYSEKQKLEQREKDKAVLTLLVNIMIERIEKQVQDKFPENSDEILHKIYTKKPNYWHQMPNSAIEAFVEAEEIRLKILLDVYKQDDGRYPYKYNSLLRFGINLMGRYADYCYYPPVVKYYMFLQMAKELTVKEANNHMKNKLDNETKGDWIKHNISYLVGPTSKSKKIFQSDESISQWATELEQHSSQQNPFCMKKNMFFYTLKLISQEDPDFISYAQSFDKEFISNDIARSYDIYDPYDKTRKKIDINSMLKKMPKKLDKKPFIVTLENARNAVEKNRMEMAEKVNGLLGKEEELKSLASKFDSKKSHNERLQASVNAKTEDKEKLQQELQDAKKHLRKTKNDIKILLDTEKDKNWFSKSSKTIKALEDALSIVSEHIDSLN